MRFINVNTYQLEEFSDCSLVEYAILSHRWEEEEILLDDLVHASGRLSQLRSLKGYYKLRKSCKEAARRGVQYVWMDTCCIDKSSSAELQEAINSMFHWYASATICFAFLSDVHFSQDHHSFATSFSSSQWFRRGWTLQELLAPPKLAFFDDQWNLINYRKRLAPQVSAITGIPEYMLTTAFDPMQESRPCLAEIMSWASDRETTRVEDRAYSLLGLFGVSIPILYGEGGERAFYRFQCELLEHTEDQSIFAWDQYSMHTPGLLAPSPDNFRPGPVSDVLGVAHALARRSPVAVHNEGIDLEVKLVCIAPRTYIGLLNMLSPKIADPGNAIEVRSNSPKPYREVFGIFLRRIDDAGRYARIPGSVVGADSDLIQKLDDKGITRKRKITVVRRLTEYERQNCEVIDDPQFLLASASGVPDHWRSWLDSDAIKITGSVQDVAGEYLSSERISMNRYTVCIKSNERNSKRLDTFPFSNIVLGYDFDYNPICVLSMGPVNSESAQRAITDVMVITSDSPFEDRHTRENRNFEIDFCNGEYRILSEYEVAFTIRTPCHDRQMMLKASVRLSNGRDVFLVLARRKGESQWNVHIDLDHDDPSAFFATVEDDLRTDGRGRYKSIEGWWAK